MIYAVDDKLISTEIFEQKFVCDLTKCKGACCIEGDQGAPLKMEEIADMEEVLEEVLPYMRPEGRAAVEAQGVAYIDPWGEPAVTLVNNSECAFVYFDETNTAKCAIEKAYLEGKTTWKKPVSCHLYPIRVSQVGEDQALNYHEWEVCSPACDLGNQLQVPVFRFLKEPIVRAFGEEFFTDLEAIEAHIKSQQTEE